MAGKKRVLFVCTGNSAKCPRWPGQVDYIHWSIDDPARVDGPEEMSGSGPSGKQGKSYVSGSRSSSSRTASVRCRDLTRADAPLRDGRRSLSVAIPWGSGPSTA